MGLTNPQECSIRVDNQGMFIDELWTGLRGSTALRSLKIDAQYTEITSVERLGEGIEKLHGLTKLELDLERTKITSVERLGEGIGKLQALKELFIKRYHAGRITQEYVGHSRMPGLAWPPIEENHAHLLGALPAPPAHPPRACSTHRSPVSSPLAMHCR